jgi:hypothetical protein
MGRLIDEYVDPAQLGQAVPHYARNATQPSSMMKTSLMLQSVFSTA